MSLPFCYVSCLFSPSSLDVSFQHNNCDERIMTQNHHQKQEIKTGTTGEERGFLGQFT